MEVVPMRANPGGEIAPEEVIGRDRLVTRIWDTLDHQSVLMVAERRIGKTTVVKKMRHSAPDGVRPVYRDVEGLRTPLEFAEVVARDIEAVSSGKARAGSKLRRLLKHLSDFEIGGVLKFPPDLGTHWSELLRAAVEGLFEEASDQLHVFVWDELPLMLDKIRHESNPQRAMDVLDTLRSLRQEHSNLRMVFTGSVGLHHVLSDLLEEGPPNDPTNDMRTMEVTELHPDHGSLLAECLIAGEKLRCSDPATTATAISAEVDHIPFYIHHVVAQMRDRGDEANQELCRDIVQRALVDAQDPWHLNHYRVRLSRRYGQDRSPIARWLLDEVAAADAPLSFVDLAKRLRSAMARERVRSNFAREILDGDDEQLRRLVVLLQRDHYLEQEPRTGRYDFRFPLIKRWWHLQGGAS
ncbi:MAG: AAA family ATPase [Myxococcota bacterium]